MCTIIGVKINMKELKYHDANKIEEYVINTAPIRGRDGFGVDFISDGKYIQYMSFRTKSYEKFIGLFKMFYKQALDESKNELIIMVQSRAIPETEEDIDIKKYQPVYITDKEFDIETYDRFYVICHNGLIYNDKELANKLKVNIEYDSQILPYLFKRYDGNLQRIYNELKGSFSIIFASHKGFGYLVNYQPLYKKLSCNSAIILTNIKDDDCVEVESYSWGFVE